MARRWPEGQSFVLRGSASAAWVVGSLLATALTACVGDLPGHTALDGAAAIGSQPRAPSQDLRIYDARGEPGTHIWTFGGQTSIDRVHGAHGVELVARLDRSSWSGITIDRPPDDLLDLTDLRATGALVLWARSPSIDRKVRVSLVDDQGDEVRVRTQLWFFEWQDLSAEWHRFEIPLQKFADEGESYDAQTDTVRRRRFRWDRVRGVALTVNRPGVVRRRDPVELHIRHVSIAPQTDWEPPARRWSRFQSDAPDRLILSASDGRRGWSSLGSDDVPRGHVVLERGSPARPAGLAIECPDGLFDRCEFDRSFQRDPSAGDWSAHAGLRVVLSADGLWPHALITLLDGDGEIWQTLVEVKSLRPTLVPLSGFAKIGVSERPDLRRRRENNRLDTHEIRHLRLAMHGVERRSFRVHSIGLTNAPPPASDRVEVGEVIDVVMSGDLDPAVGQPIEEGILGINGAVWDSDLLDVETTRRVGRVGHVTVRYPGGLTADAHHWEDELAAKDPDRVDTDEFLSWSQQVGVAPVFTVNVGSGTPAEAARWVAHTRGRVRHWELGNELYGPWHPHQMTPEAYAARASDFIDAMKAVDPDIEIAVVGDSDRDHAPWNRVVLDVVGHKADAIVLHPYVAGPEQPTPYRWVRGALSSTTFPLIRRFQQAVNAHPNTRGPLPIWLTEWNLASHSPDERTLTMEQAFYVVDMLGGLAALGGIELAHYWAIHNDVTPRGGDYGYLSRSYDAAGGHRPRPAYFAFRMAADTLRGRLQPVDVERDEVSAYLTRHGDGTTSLLLANRHRTISFAIENRVPGLVGRVLVETLVEQSGEHGPSRTTAELATGDRIALPPASITRLSTAVEPSDHAHRGQRSMSRDSHGSESRP